MTGPSIREAARVGIRAVPLTDGLAAELKRTLAEVERELKLQIPASLDTTQAREDLRRLQADLDGTAVQIGAGLNAADARAELDRLRAEVDSSKGDIKVGLDRSRADSDVSAVRSGLSSLASIAKTIVVGAGIATAVAGLATAVVQGVALAAALASAAGAAALIPAAVAAIGAVAATTLIGLSGIGDALKAQTKASTAAGGGTGGNPNAAADSARQVAAAQRGLQAAYRNTADQRVQDARRIVDAEQAIKDAQAAGRDTHASDIQAIADAEVSYTRAQRDELRAQTDLNQARAQAAQQLADLKVQLSGAAVDQEQAALDLAKAQKALADTQANDFATGLEKQSAQVAVDQAAQKVAAAAQNYSDLKDKSDKANAAGVDGASNVIAAQDRLTDAIANTGDAQRSLADARAQLAKDDLSSTRAIAKAEQDLADARRQQAKDQLDAANTIADAQDRLAQASESAATKAGGGAAGIAAATAMSKLSPEARALVTALLALGPAWESVKFAVQDRLLDGVSGRITTLAGRALPALRAGLVGVAGSLNTAAKGAIDFAGRTSTLQAVSLIFTDVHRTIDALLPALHPLYQALLLVLQVGAGFGPGLAAGFAGFLTTVANGISRAARDGDLQRFISNAILVVKQLAQIAINVGSILFSVFSAGQDSGGRLLASIVAITGRLAELARSSQGQGALRAVFAGAETAVRTVIDLLRQAGPYVERFFGQFRSGLGPSAQGSIDSIKQSLQTIGPVLAGALVANGAGTFNAVLKIAAAVLGEVADHAGMLAKVLPLMAAGFALAKLAGAASNLVALADVPLQIAKLVTTRMQTLALRENTAALAANAAVQEAATVATAENEAATIGQTIAQKAAAVASKAWAAAQWLLNAAMDANPVVLVVLGILALVAAFVLAYQHSERFRAIVQASFAAIAAAATALWQDGIRPAVDFIVGGFRTVASAAAAVLSWIRSHWPLLLAILTGPIGLAVLEISRHWGTIMAGITAVRDWISARVGDITGAFARIPGAIVGLASRARSAGAGLMKALIDGITSALGKVGGAVTNIAAAIWNGLASIINKQFVDPIRQFHVGLHKGPINLDFTPFDSMPELPRLGAGATVLPTAGGTLAVLAEVGRPETVVDTGLLNKQLDLTNRLAQKVLESPTGGGNTFNLPIYTTDQDPTLTAAVVSRKLAEVVS